VFGAGNPHNDYGLGFYCTKELELAKEWACAATQSGFANRYTLDIAGLSVLDLADGEHHILNWLAVLLQNRIFQIDTPLAEEARDYLISVFSPDYEGFDVLAGYRADDSYFSFARAFLAGGLSLEQLGRAMRLGELGMQTVLRSKAAFARLRHEGYEQAAHEEYYSRRAARDAAARKALLRMRGEGRAAEAVYVLDVLRERWQNDDARLQRILPE